MQFITSKLEELHVHCTVKMCKKNEIFFFLPILIVIKTIRAY